MKEIMTALNEAYKECGYVQKAGVNKEQKYKFAGEADFIEAVRPVLTKHGIAVFPVDYDMILSENYSTKSGSRMNRIVAKYTFRFAHTSGQHIDVIAIGEGSDTSDKASPKAATIALKYALRQALLIETGDDPDQSTPEPAPSHDEMRERAQLKMEEIRTELAVLSDLQLADWVLDTLNGDKIKSLQWIKRNYPDIFAEIQNLGFDV